MFEQIIPHLLELRTRLIKFFGLFLAIFLLLLPYANQVYLWIAEPLIQHLPPQAHLIATQVTSPFFVPLKACLFMAFTITLPVLFYQFWQFVSPALYQQERRFLLPIIFTSLLLFLVGNVFVYHVIFPLMFSLMVLPQGVLLMMDIGNYLSAFITLAIAFGVAFQLPIVIILLVRWNIIQLKTLQAGRPYAIVLAFTLGAILTPPDVISQTLMALPLWLLFEIGLFIAKFSLNHKIKKEITHD